MQAEVGYASHTLQPEPADAGTPWVAPSAEHRWLLRHAAWLVSPADGRGSPLSRLLRSAMVAPMTQLTFFSFDMQCFLYQVFHTTWAARLGHLVGMTAEVLFLLAALSAWPIGAGVHAGHVFAALLGIWYVGVASAAGLRVWAAVATALVVGLSVAADAVALRLAQAGGDAPDLWTSPWLWACVSSFVVAVSHAPEPKLPPRAIGSSRWRRIDDYILGGGEPELSVARKVARALRVAAFVPLGTVNELWAGLRLMPYGWLMVMFRLGYAPRRWAALQALETAALRDGNPALDFVGVGGGAMLVVGDDGQLRPHAHD